VAGERDRDRRLDRLLVLVDGVFAIALTLLSFGLHLPESAAQAEGRELLHALLGTWPEVLSFLTSFAFIALFWQANHQIFQRVRGFDGRLMWLVLALLAAVAFLPYPTAVIAKHVADPVAWYFYYLSLLAASLLNAATWGYSVRAGLLEPGLSPRLVRHYNRLRLGAPLACVLIMLLALLGVGRLINPLVLGYVAILAYIVSAVRGRTEPESAETH
jgi:uncharacterized membrane protein